MNKHHRTGFRPLTAAILVALYPAQFVVAQSPDAESDGVLEEVIVTATYRAMNLQDLPQSIQAFTTDDIIRNNFSDFQDIANAIPSLTIVAVQPGRNSVKFRGLSTGTQEFYTDSAVGVYLDETPLTLNSQQVWPAMVDIERVESLPGPQGTLFGASSQGGTLRMITNKPNYETFSGEVYGNYYATKGGSGSWEVNGHLNIPLIKDTLALRVVAYTKEEGGWIDNVPGETFVQPDPRFITRGNNATVVEDDQNKYQLTGARVAALWDINEDWQTILSFITEKNEGNGFWGEDPTLADNEIIRFFDDYYNDDWWNASLVLTGDLGFATLTSASTYLDRTIVYESDNMIYEQWNDAYFGVNYPLYDGEYTFGTNLNDQAQDRFAQELRLTSSTDSRLQWMAGAFYEDTNDGWLFGATNPDLMETTAWEFANYLACYYENLGYDVDCPLPPTTLSYAQYYDRTVKQLAFFGEVSYDLTDKWSATVGLRWFQFKRDDFHQYFFPQGLPAYGGLDSNGAYTSASKDSGTAPKFSTQYAFDDDKMVYFLYSEGYRLGGQNSLRAANTGRVPLVYQPDYLKNYEVGLKSEWRDDTLQLNVTLFYMDYSNYQINDGNIDGIWWLRGTVNANSVENKGVEIFSVWQVTDALRFEAAYYHGKFESTSRFEFQNGDVMEPGDTLPNSPPDKYRLAVDYTLPFHPFGGDMWVRFDYSHSAGSYIALTAAVNELPDGVIPAWYTANLQLGMKLPSDWELTFFVNNLTNEEVINSFAYNYYASDWFGVDTWRLIEFTQRPRHYGLSIRKQF